MPVTTTVHNVSDDEEGAGFVVTEVTHGSSETKTHLLEVDGEKIDVTVTVTTE